MPKLRSVLLRRLHEFFVHSGQTWSSIVLNCTAPSLSRRQLITSTKKSFRSQSSLIVRGGERRVSGPKHPDDQLIATISRTQNVIRKTARFAGNGRFLCRT
ncbi:MAG: hypothetical protein C0483_03700 [Pirellula sp.]|nr:hypothetical protein [Pirellula sp.]